MNERNTKKIFSDSENTLLQDVVSSIPVGICVFQRREDRMQCVSVNACYAGMVGAEEKDLIGEEMESSFSRVHPDDLERFRKEMVAPLDKIGQSGGTYRIYNRKDQRYYWRHLDVRLIPRADGNYDVCFACSSVGEPAATADQNQQTPQSIVQQVPGGVFVYSAEEDEQFSFVSPNMLAMLGYTREEFDQKFHGRFSQMIYREDRERVLKEIWSQIKSGPFDTCCYRIEKKDGSLVWVHDEGHIVADSDGRRSFYVVIVDITSSVLASNDLRSQNNEFKRLIDSIPVSIVVYRQHENRIRIAGVNGYLNKVFKETANSLLSMTEQEILNLIHPEDREMVIRFFSLLFTTDHVISELTYRTTVNVADRYQWYHCSAVQIPDSDGSRLVYAVYTDATYQKVKEESFNRMIEELLNANPAALCTFRLNLTQNLCSNGYGASAYIRQLLNARTADELLEKVAMIITEKGEAEKFRRNYSRSRLMESFQKGKERVSVTYHRMTDNGESHWVTTNFHILRNPYTDDLEAIVYSVDSDHARKEEEIVSVITGEEYDYIGLIDTGTDQISFYYFSSENDLSQSSIPKTYTEMIRLLSERTLSAPEKEEYLDNMKTENLLKELSDSPVYTYAYTCLNKSGESRRKQVSFRYLEPGHKEIMFSRSDITDVFRREEATLEKLREALLCAQKANEMKSDFLGNVSHDMRTPLNAILGYNNLAAQSGDLSEIKGYLQKIESAGSTLLSLINDTLDLQKIETGSVELKPEPYNCGDVIRDVVTSVRPLMEKKNIRFVLDNSRAVMATINVDITRIKQIFINLLSNAIKFTPEGGRIDLVIECVKFEPRCVHDRIIIRDNGIGMSQSFQEKMFEPFAQERTKKTAQISGSGLGLPIVKRLVDLMGGTIEVKSELGKGTEFTICLDFERMDDILPKASREAGENPDIAGVKILLCEDNEMNSEIAGKILTMNGALVTAASDGLEGFQKFAGAKPGEFDIVLMDIRMPNMDGYAATRKIRNSGLPGASTIPVIAMSADAYASDVEKALACGMNGHISKPIDPNKLMKEIAHAVGQNTAAADKTLK